MSDLINVDVEFSEWLEKQSEDRLDVALERAIRKSNQEFDYDQNDQLILSERDFELMFDEEGIVIPGVANEDKIGYLLYEELKLMFVQDLGQKFVAAGLLEPYADANGQIRHRSVFNTGENIL